MKTKNILILFAAASACANGYGQTYTATQSGNWSDGGTWNQGGAIPGMDETSGVKITLNRDAAVTLDSGAYSVGSIEDPGRYNGSGPSSLIVSGSGTSLNATGLRLYYDSQLDLKVLDGATVNAGDISWGANANVRVNITVTDANFSGRFSQMQGSPVQGYGKILINGASAATATGTWSMNPKDSSAANATALLQIDGNSTLSMAGSYGLYASAEAAGSTARIVISNGGRVINGQAVGIGHKANASSIIQIYGAGSSFTNAGAASQSLTVGSATSGGVLENAVSRLTFGGYENGGFVAATAQSMYINYEVKFQYGSSLEYILGDSNFSTGMDSKSIFEGNFFKQVMGDLLLDFSNVGELEEGVYYVALVTSTSGQSFWHNQDASYAFEDHVVVDGLAENVTYDGLVFNGGKNQMFAQITVDSLIPEPSTYAALFGALALAFAAYRRRQ